MPRPPFQASAGAREAVDPAAPSSTGSPGAPLAYYWGDDGYGVERGPERLRARLAGGDVEPDRVRVAGSATTAEQIAERVATAPLFGGGTLLVVAEPGPLVASKALAARLAAALTAVAPGNGLAFVETVDGTGRRPASLAALAKSIADAGGEVREFSAPKQADMTRWIGERAAELRIRITPAAAAVLAQRIGAFVREGDVDRRRQGALAVAELQKLGLYRLDAPIAPADVEALVADAVPGSAWAFLDAVGMRRAGEAAELAERLEDAVPAPVLVVRLHRRLRELIEVVDLLSSGATPQSLVRTLKLNPFVARKLTEQARAWTLPELEAALAGLLELDATLKGHDGGGETRRRAAVSLWIAERVRAAR